MVSYFKMMSVDITSRQILFGIVLAVALLMGYALYSQYINGLEPCPLCMTQRFFYCLTGLIALIAVIHKPERLGLRIYSSLVILSSLGGTFIAARQVWLQHLPEDEVPACGPDLEYMLETFPFSDVLKALFLGDGNCAEVVWRFLGLSMPEWSLIWFLILSATGIWLLIRTSRH